MGSEMVFGVAMGIVLFVVGTVVGSFLNVVIYRLPRGESVSGIGEATGSHCPHCGRALRFGDLIPLLSWLALGGRCRSCGVRISGRYFAVELLTALLFLAAGFSEGMQPTLDLGHKLILIVLFIPILFIDLDHKIVPDELSVPLFGMGLIWNVVQGLTGQPWLVSLHTHGLFGGTTPGFNLDLTLPTSLLFAVVGAGIFWLIQWFGEVVFKKEAMGLGDVNIAAGVGANFALIDSLCSFGIAVAVGAAAGIVLIALRRRDMTDAVAFGPMLVAGATVMLLMPGPVHGLVQMYRSTFL